MYHLLLLLLLCATSCIRATPAHSEIYNYEINIDDVVNNPSRADFYYNCIMETGPCSRESALMRLFIPEALKGCDACPEKMQPALKGFMDYLVTEGEEEFLAMAAKYDEEDGIFKKLQQKRLGKMSRKNLRSVSVEDEDDDVLVMQRDVILFGKARGDKYKH